MGDFGSPDPDANPEADIKPPKFSPPKRGASAIPPKPSGEVADPLKPAAKPDGEVVKKGDEKPSADKPVTEEFNPEKAAPKQLREAFHKTKSRVTELEKELAEFKSKPATPAEDPEKKVFQEKLTAAEKRTAELLEDLKYVDFEKHPDFAKDYQEPFENAYNAGRNHVTKMSVKLPDGTTRKGTAEDFDAIVSKAVQDYDAAAEMAEEMFGPVKAATVLTKLSDATALFDKKEKARSEWKIKGNEREKARTAESQKFQEAVAGEVKTHWEQSLGDAQKKYQQWSAPVEGDEIGNELLEKGYKLASEAFASFDVMSPKLDKQQRADLVAKHASVFNKSAWFDRLAHKHSETVKENKALKTKLAEFEASTPKGGEGGRGAPATSEEEGEQGIAAFVRNGKR